MRSGVIPFLWAEEGGGVTPEIADQLKGMLLTPLWWVRHVIATLAILLPLTFLALLLVRVTRGPDPRSKKRKITPTKRPGLRRPPPPDDGDAGDAAAPSAVVSRQPSIAYSDSSRGPMIPPPPPMPPPPVPYMMQQQQQPTTLTILPIAIPDPMSRLSSLARFSLPGPPAIEAPVPMFQDYSYMNGAAGTGRPSRAFIYGSLAAGGGSRVSSGASQFGYPAPMGAGAGGRRATIKSRALSVGEEEEEEEEDSGNETGSNSRPRDGRRGTRRSLRKVTEVDVNNNAGYDEEEEELEEASDPALLTRQLARSRQRELR